MLVSLSLSLLLCSPLAQLPEDPGPFSPGFRKLTFADANYGAGNVRVQVHYPALTEAENAAPDLSGAPYPSVALMHGWLGSAAGLDDLANHMASHGFLVINLDTEKGLFPNVPAYAVDARASLQWMEDESGDPASFLSGMAQAGPWAAVGHSMGGGALSHLIGIEPRVSTIIGMQAASADPPGPDNMRAYQGAGLWIAGSVDGIVPPGTVRAWYNRAEQAQRRFFFVVDGMGHAGPLDNPPNNEPMPGATQQAVHRRMLTAFLDAQIRGNEAAFAFLAGEVGSGAPWTMEQDCADPILWGGGTDLSASGARFGVLGEAGQRVSFAWSTALGSTSTPFGPSGLDLGFGGVLDPILLPAEGFGQGIFAFPPSWSGTTAYFQAAVYASAVDGELTDVLAVEIP